MASVKELLEELKVVFSGRNSIIDSALPPLVFIIINSVSGLIPALWAASGVAVAITVLRLIRRQSLRYALAGIGAALLAVILVVLLGRAEAYFIPALVNGALMVVILAVSILLKKPAVAFTSHLTRRWPLEWYWHPKVRPAYSEVTVIWMIYSGVKLIIQLSLYQLGKIESLAVFNLVSGWPFLVVLLILSYVYGLRRLRKLQGPSVEEFLENASPPWKGQKRGF